MARLIAPFFGIFAAKADYFCSPAPLTENSAPDASPCGCLTIAAPEARSFELFYGAPGSHGIQDFTHTDGKLQYHDEAHSMDWCVTMPYEHNRFSLTPCSIYHLETTQDYFTLASTGGTFQIFHQKTAPSDGSVETMQCITAFKSNTVLTEDQHLYLDYCQVGPNQPSMYFTISKELPSFCLNTTVAV